MQGPEQGTPKTSLPRAAGGLGEVLKLGDSIKSASSRGYERLGAGKDAEECLMLSGRYRVSDQEDSQLCKWS